MKNSFERHGIEHLSVSTINLFAAEPALFVAQKLLKRTNSVGAAAHRGTASETGIVKGLLDTSIEVEACQNLAVSEFDRLTALSGDPRRTKEREAIPGIVDVAIKELRQYGIPTGIQVKINKQLPDVPIPWLGYADLVWNQHGLTLDIKTQLKLASEISATHARQVALYIYGTDHHARVGYFTPTKCGVYILRDAETRITELVNIAKRMEKFLSISADPMELASFVVPNVDSFYYSDQTTRAMAREVFGL